MIFVVGNSRSGTTMLARILGKSARIHTLSEVHFIEQMVSGEEFRSSEELAPQQASALVGELLSAAKLGYFAQRKPEQFAEDAARIVTKLESRTRARLFRATLNELAAEAGKSMVCEQTPRNVFYISDILDAFETAVVVNIVRDPRDVLLSQKHKWKRRRMGGPIPTREALRSWMNYHPLTMSKLWSAAVSAGLRHSKTPRVLTIRFEDLLAEPRKVLDSVCAHVGVTFEDAMLDVEQIGSSSRGDQTDVRGVDASRIEAWRKGDLTGAEIFICERENAELMKSLGYEPSGAMANPIAIGGQYVLLPFKLVGALALNLSRVRSLASWAQQRLLAKAT